ncbi:MAG: hypothetical protein IJM20_00385 [Clostridia bacterium]|nr:hypothetical protein [Clostridia bacterium]
MKKILSLMIAVIMLLGIFTGCSKSGTEKTDGKSGDVSLDGYKWTDGVIVIDGVLYRVSVDPYSKFKDNGWIMQEKDQEISDHVIVFVHLRNSKFSGSYIRLDMYNKSGERKLLSESTVDSIGVVTSSKDEPETLCDFELPGGIKRGASIDEIEAAYGKPTNIDVISDDHWILWYYDDNAKIELELSWFKGYGLQEASIDDKSR